MQIVNEKFNMVHRFLQLRTNKQTWKTVKYADRVAEEKMSDLQRQQEKGGCSEHCGRKWVKLDWNTVFDQKAQSIPAWRAVYRDSQSPLQDHSQLPKGAPSGLMESGVRGIQSTQSGSASNKAATVTSDVHPRRKTERTARRSGTLSSCKMDTRVGYRVVPRKDNDARERASCGHSCPPFQKPGRVFTDSAKEFIKACQGLQWTHDTNTLHRSATNGIAEREVRRVEEGTATAMVQSGQVEQWCDCARNFIATCESCTTRWPMARQRMRKNWCNLRWAPNPVRSPTQLQTHLSPKASHGCIKSAVFRAGRWWSGNLLIADCEDFENLSAFEIHVERSTHQEVAHAGHLWYPCADGTLKLFDLPQPPRGDMPATRNPEVDEKEEERDTVSEEENSKTNRSMSGDFIYRHHEVHRSKFHFLNETTFSITLNTSMSWGKREQASVTPPNTPRTHTGMTGEKSYFQRNRLNQHVSN